MSMDSFMAEKNVSKIAVFAIFSVMLSSISDVAIDGWVFTMFRPEKRSLGSACQSMGQNFGWFTSQYIFISLSSSTFCKSVFGS